MIEYPEAQNQLGTHLTGSAVALWLSPGATDSIKLSHYLALLEGK